MVKKGVPTKFSCTHCPYSGLTTPQMKKHTHAKHPHKVTKQRVEPNPVEKEQKRKKKDESPETSMTAPPKKKLIVPKEQTKKEETPKEAEDMDMEEETVTLPKNAFTTLQDNLEEKERENEELRKRSSDTIDQLEIMAEKLSNPEANHVALNKDMLELKALLTTPILGVGTPIQIPGQEGLCYDCSLCAQKGMDKTTLYRHLEKMKNVKRGDLDQ